MKWKPWVRTALMIGIVLLCFRLVPSHGAKAPTLTALDRAEIQELSARYVQALDTCAENDLADLFTPDGALISGSNQERTEGHAALAAFVVAPANRCAQATPLTVKHISANVVLEASPEGATGKSYFLSVKMGKDGRSGEIVFGGKYFDAYVKTPKGWRFKSREILAATP